jgi:primosomal replication protein N
VHELDSLRYSPAGLPLLNMTLQHESQQIEAGGLRSTELTLSAVAAGPVAVQLNAAIGAQGLGAYLQCEGFLAARRNSSKSLGSKITSKAMLLHITAFKILEK